MFRRMPRFKSVNKVKRQDVQVGVWTHPLSRTRVLFTYLYRCKFNFFFASCNKVSVKSSNFAEVLHKVMASAGRFARISGKPCGILSGLPYRIAPLATLPFPGFYGVFSASFFRCPPSHIPSSSPPFSASVTGGGAMSVRRGPPPPFPPPSKPSSFSQHLHSATPKSHT